MEFDTLKSDWKKTGNAKKNQEELLMMTKIKNHPIIKRIRIQIAGTYSKKRHQKTFSSYNNI